DNDNYGVIKARFNGKGILVAGSDELSKGEKVSVAVSPCGDYTVSYLVDDDDTCVDDFGTPADSVFEQNDTLNIALSTAEDVALSPEQEEPTEPTTATTAAPTAPVSTTKATEITPIYDNCYFLYGSNALGSDTGQWEYNDKGTVFSDRNAHGFTVIDRKVFQLYGRARMQYDVGQSIPSFNYGAYTTDTQYLESGVYNLVVLQYAGSNVATYRFSADEISKSANNVYGTAQVTLNTVDFTNDTPSAVFSGGKIRAFDIGQFELKDGVNNKIAIRVNRVTDEMNDLNIVAFAAIPANSSEITTSAPTAETTVSPTTATPTTTIAPTTAQTTAPAVGETVEYDAYDAAVDGPNVDKM
ncbi:MAG: hypothetical protein ACI396_04250, partial [Acutalibacteraceae bacterium]